MRDRLGPETTLSYCANVHPASSLDSIAEQLEAHAAEVRRRVCPGEKLGIGLWIPAAPPRFGEAVGTAATLMKLSLRKRSRRIARLRSALDTLGLEAVTCNAFPLYDFHQPVVKHAVYEPDWTSVYRAAHTSGRVGLMDELNPAQAGCSVSTLPIGWRESPDADADRAEIAGFHLRHAVEFLSKFGNEFGVHSTIDLEPEPGCILDTASDVIAFFDEHLPDESHRTHIGVCHDVCHAAVMFEDQRTVLRRYAEAGIRVNKVQISSALDVDVRTIGVETAIEHLKQFAEPRYLHQTGFMTGGEFELIEDLPEAIERLEAGASPDRLRVHFHVPVYLDSIGPLGTTNDQIAEAVAAAREYHDTKHFEVETYAWGVLPDELKRDTLAEGIADELKWVLTTCGEGSPHGRA
jgi:sugar phosphate isomerase/epimerase